MAPFRPSNLNKRAYPGNAGVIGPTVTTTCSASTTTCTSTTNSKTSCVCSALALGCRCSFCGCPCCDIVCSCDVTVCDRTIPSGMWKTSEQYEAKGRDAWGAPSSSNTPETCLCCINEGYSDISNLVDYKGYYIKECAGTKIFANAGTQISCCWSCRTCAIACANSEMGSCGWFIPSCACLVDFINCAPGCPGRYWNGSTGVPAFTYYMSDTFGNQSNWFWAARWINNSGGQVQAPGFAFIGNQCGDLAPIRVFRCV